MRYVLDANVALKIALPEYDSARAIQLQADFRSGLHQLLAPDFFPVELGHALTRAERKRLIPVGYAAGLFDDIIDPCPILHSAMLFMPRAIELSSRLRVSVYDAVYFLMAEEQDCAFVTADRKILKAFPNEPRILELSRI
ncbi:MAG TPA: type II toxin-antitoxin system VapC family toxin [Pirellulales bacterium]|jgi:predicted nucleic acid-binding protein|nr:type II toxin-antitoxin system VapC family toxin [Pirellulales bacterium]